MSVYYNTVVYHILLFTYNLYIILHYTCFNFTIFLYNIHDIYIFSKYTSLVVFLHNYI